MTMGPNIIRSAASLGSAAPGKSKIMHVAFFVRPIARAKFLQAVQELLLAHPDAVVTMTGLDRTASHERIVLGIDPGPLSQIARHSDQCLAAFNFAHAATAALFDFTPRYCPAPSDDMAAVALLVSPKFPLRVADVVPAGIVIKEEPFMVASAAESTSTSNLSDLSEKDATLLV